MARNKISEILGIDVSEADIIVAKAIDGGEVIGDDFSDWLTNRFLPNIVYIDESGYARMCVDALKILQTTAATDYGSSRQRDLGQLWGDMTRGYLAEFAFTLFLKEKWNIDTRLGHEQGSLIDYLPMDIHKVKKESDKEFRDPAIKVSVKGTKWNGIWFDIPNQQFSHSDVNVLVKVGVTRDHLFAYFRHISVFKDKILKKGMEIGAISQTEADFLYEALPKFRRIPAYIAGFVIRDYEYAPLSYGGSKGRVNYTISSWNGPIQAGDLDQIKINESIKGSVKFKSIGSFAHDRGYLFNTGNLRWSASDCQRLVINRL